MGAGEFVLLALLAGGILCIYAVIRAQSDIKEMFDRQQEMPYKLEPKESTYGYPTLGLAVPERVAPAGDAVPRRKRASIKRKKATVKKARSKTKRKPVRR